MFLSIPEIHLKLSHVGITLHLLLFILFLTLLRSYQGHGTPAPTLLLSLFSTTQRLLAWHLPGHHQPEAVEGQRAQNLPRIALKSMDHMAEKSPRQVLRGRRVFLMLPDARKTGSFFAQQSGGVHACSETCNKSAQHKGFCSLPSESPSHAEVVWGGTNNKQPGAFEFTQKVCNCNHAFRDGFAFKERQKRQLWAEAGQSASRET